MNEPARIEPARDAPPPGEPVASIERPEDGPDRSLDPALFVVRQRKLLAHVWRHFVEDRCLEEAASLSYTSLLAMVPLLAVIFGIVAAFPVFSEWSQTLQSFIFDNLVPTAGNQVESYMTSFLGSISNLTLPGTVALIVTALLLMFRVEVAFNRIWRVKKSRALTGRIVMYWAVLTLGPILIGAGVALSAQKVMGAIGIEGAFTGAWNRVGTFVLGWAVFSMMFTLIPYRRVRFRDAAAGALLSAVLFELAKLAFVAYVRNANYTVIYGALATIPIFLFWLYIVWSVILFGASLTASLTTYRQVHRREGSLPLRLDFLLVFRLVGHLWQAQREGRELSEKDLLDLEPKMSASRLAALLARLQSEKVVQGDHDNGWILRRDLGDYTLLDLYQSSHCYLPVGELGDYPAEDEWDRVFVRSVEAVEAGGEAVLGASLRSLYAKSPEQET